MVLLAFACLAAPAEAVPAPAAPAKVKPAIPAAVKPAPAKPTVKDEHMVVEADQVVYDNDADTVTAVGHVEIHYKGNTLTARKVTYLRGSKRVIAEGDARMVDKDGNVLTSPKLDVSDGFVDGFVESLRIDTIDRSRFAAESATRSGGDVTVFEKGVYTACQTCVNDPATPPFWQIKAARIIHKQQEKMVYYEDARLEMAGIPIAWVPYFRHPDPSETRKTGFLMPRVIDSSTLGLGVQVPFFWAPTPDWDATFSPVALSRQGVLLDLEVRHRFDAGVVTARVFGIDQMNPGAFRLTSGDRERRGALVSTGRFTINENWKWGWDATFVSDRRFLSDYRISPFAADRSVSTLFLTGEGLRNHFDARLYRFSVYNDDLAYDKYGNKLLFGSGTSLQDKQPVVHPVVDYDFVAPRPVAGGELSAHLNLTSLTRDKTDIDTYGRVLGIAGTFTRVSGMVGWRRQIIDDIGQVYTPFASLRGDVFFDKTTDPTLVGFVNDGTLARVTPTIGFDYRFPFVAGSSFGSHTFEPIAQLVARPNEQWMGKLPNEDAQSVVFDDTTLFRPDKFSGWDRAEGGTRLNVGAQYSFLAPNGGSLSALLGRSYLLAGANSFAYPDYTRLIAQAALGRPAPLTAYGSGLETNTSDWVARVTLDSATGFRIGAQTRFDHADFTLNRADIQATGTSGPLSAGIGWAYLRTPRELYDLLTAYDTAGVTGAAAIRNALKDARSELQTHANLRLATNWRLFGGVRYDLKSKFISGNVLGVGYDNDSFSISLSYTDSTYTAVDTSTLPVTVGSVHDQTMFLRFGFRTLGDGQLSNSLSSSN
ncbi:MAG: LPS-assembly protein LptD [Siculibacillus sp.]|nr:LPS-assembly protein LptD [Siculibacillus sp.]